MFLQETFVVYDCIKFDIGTLLEHTDSIWNNMNYITRYDEYSTIYSESSEALKYTTITGDIIIELDVMSNLSSQGTFLSIRNGTTILRNVSLSNVSMTTNEWKHLKIKIEDGLLSIENSSITDVDVTGFNRLFLRASANYSTSFKNLKIYSI